MLLYFVLKIITVTNLGVLASHRNIPSFLNPSMLSTVYPAVQLNIYIYTYLCFMGHIASSSLCFHTERSWSRKGSLLHPPSLFFCAFITNEEYQTWQPWRLKSFVCTKGPVLSARGWDFTFTLFQQYWSTMPWETSKNHQQKSKEWAILRLTSQGSLRELPRKPIRTNCICHLGWNTSETMELLIYGSLKNSPIENNH